ncbi:MAG: hypothetical protein JJ863_13975 [Deltaproteobacteria bacterium]|nr:hypothetical protein [Deltaproteobacteria bacterium]
MRVLVVLGLLGFVVACDGDSERNEANLLLTRLEAIRSDDLGEWRRKVDSLEAMPLEFEGNQAVRDKCHAMHDALLRAEEATEEARQMMDTLEAGGEGDPQVVADALARSEAAIAETRDLRRPCENAHAELKTRFASQREGS